MAELKFCPECGASLIAGDKFCGECGFNLANLAVDASSDNISQSQPVGHVPPVYTAGSQPTGPSAVRNYNLDEQEPEMPPPQRQEAIAPVRPQEPPRPEPVSPPAVPPSPRDNYGSANLGGNLGTSSGGNKGPLIIVALLLLVMFSVGGGLYWWFSSRETGGQPNNVISPSDNINLPANTSNNLGTTAPNNEASPLNMDLSRAATYLGKPGMKYTFYVNYPDGNAAIVERIAGLAVPNEAVRISEVELGMEHGEEYGFGFHYVERADGTYYILDTAPFEIFPLLKNNLTIGQTWNYQDEFGDIIWTVLDMGVDLDLGFAKFSNCLIVKEDNKAVGWETITYYAPGHGSVYVIAPGGGMEYYKMTAMEKMDAGVAADFIKKWCPNYQDIKDDRSQSY